MQDIFTDDLLYLDACGPPVHVPRAKKGYFTKADPGTQRDEDDAVVLATNHLNTCLTIGLKQQEF
jgi:hypothetical protein